METEIVATNFKQFLYFVKIVFIDDKITKLSYWLEKNKKIKKELLKCYFKAP